MSHRLLIVDDEATTLFAMREYFSTRGFEVDCAQETGEALALLGRHQYTAVIADLRLTGSQSMEGFELADFVRKRWSSTRVIILTAYDSPGIKAKARACRIDVFLRKPHPLPDLERIILDLRGRAPDGSR
jgi:DNA-binding response OmpR family regulator